MACLALLVQVALGQARRLTVAPGDIELTEEQAATAKQSAEALLAAPTPRRALLTLSTNEAQFPGALQLAAQVVLGGQRCPAVSASIGGYLCASGVPSVDGRTCCDALCAEGDDCCGPVTSICATMEETRCAMPREEQPQEWDIVIFDYSMGRPRGINTVSFADLWSEYVPAAGPAPDLGNTVVTRIRDAGRAKLEFARLYLDPAVGDFTEGYEWTLMWDADGIVPGAKPGTQWDACTFLRLLRASGAGLGQPAYSRKSKLTSWMLDNGQWLDNAGKLGGLYRYRRHVEVGFWAWRADWWVTMHSVLEAYPFVYWYADMLPMKCLIKVAELNLQRHLDAKRGQRVKRSGVVIVDATPIEHPNNWKQLRARKEDGSKLTVNSTYISKFEGPWFAALHAQYMCKHLYTKAQLNGKTKGMLRGGGVKVNGVWVPEVAKAKVSTNKALKKRVAWGGSTGGL